MMGASPSDTLAKNEGRAVSTLWSDRRPPKRPSLTWLIVRQISFADFVLTQSSTQLTRAFAWRYHRTSPLPIPTLVRIYVLQ
jgi:hypothetical protein